MHRHAHRPAGGQTCADCARAKATGFVGTHACSTQPPAGVFFLLLLTIGSISASPETARATCRSSETDGLTSISTGESTSRCASASSGSAIAAFIKTSKMTERYAMAIVPRYRPTGETQPRQVGLLNHGQSAPLSKEHPRHLVRPTALLRAPIAHWGR